MTTSSVASRIQANLKDLFKADLAPGDAYIRFQLTSDMTALLSMEQVQESLVVEAEKITALPSMPEAVVGIMNSRDRVFCVFDLAQLLQLPSSLIAPRQYQIIVLEVSAIISSEQSLYLGLAVNRLQGIARLTTEQINSATDSFPSSMIPYLHSCVIETNKPIPIFSLSALIKALVKDCG